MRAPIDYADSRGLSIAYSTVGDGDRNIVFVPGFVSHLDMVWDVPGPARLLERLASLGRLTLFDKRGTGLSDRTLGVGTLEDRMDDLRAVLDAGGIDGADLVGISEGGPLALMFAAVYPERVHSVSTIGAFVWGPLSPDFPSPERARQEVRELIETTVGRWGTGEAIRRFIKIPDDRVELMARFERNSCTPSMVRRILQANVEIDARGLLPAISVPTLVVSAAGDPLVPVPASEVIVSGVEGARLEIVEGDFHLSWRAVEMDRYADAVETFLTGAPPGVGRSVDRVLATVLFTDLVRSTELATEYGDERWRSVLDDHDRIGREEVDRHRGRWVKSTGDGLLATFDGPGRAVLAAQAIAGRLGGLDLEMRAGIHTGEIEQRDDDVGGLAVHVAARVMAEASDGEIWVSPTVPGLVIGSTLVFADRGTHELKGIPGSWQLSAVVA